MTDLTTRLREAAELALTNEYEQRHWAEESGATPEETLALLDSHRVLEEALEEIENLTPLNEQARREIARAALAKSRKLLGGGE